MRFYCSFALLLIGNLAYGQTAGTIITAATPVVNPMNPNGDSYITSHNGPFSGPLDETQFELPFIPIQQYGPESAEDNQASGGCSMMELVSDPGRGAESSYYYYSNPDGVPDNGDEVIIFRFRLAKYTTNDYGFSILLDTDGKFGFSGPNADPDALTGNPGFEREVNAYNSGDADGRVKVFNINGVASTPAAPLFSYSKTANYQVAKALNYDVSSSCSEVIFVDFYVPFSNLGISSSTPVRMAAAVNEDIGSAIGDGATDIAGVDGDDPSFYQDDNQFLAAILNYTPAAFRPEQAPDASNASVTLAENSSGGTTVHGVSATDPDGDVLSYSMINGNTGNAFAVNGTTGVITVNNLAALDFEATPAFTLTVRVSDGTLSDDAIITVNLTNINEAPVAADASVSLEENKINGTSIHPATGTDVDASTVLGYSIIGGNTNSAFAINASTGVITVNNTSALDFETTHVFTLTVRVSDGTLSDDAIITVNLTNINEAPVAADASVSLEENKINGSSVHTASGSDVDAGTVLTYSIIGGNTNSAFAINASTGAITVSNTSALDFETIPVFTLAVRASDGTLFDDAIITVNLTNLNEAPVAGDASVSLEENKTNGTSVHTAIGTDVDASTILAFSIIGGNTNSAFAINASTGVITVNNTSALDFETTPVFTLTVRASDGTLFDDAIITVNLTNVNEAPVAVDASISLEENKTNGTSVHTATGTDVDASTVLAYSIIGGNTNSAFAINASTGAITVNNTSALDFETTPVFTLAVRASDGTLSDDAIITINLTNVNEAPVAGDASVSLEENKTNGTSVHTATGNDVDASAVLVFSIIGGNTNSAFAINASTGVITVNNTSALDFETAPVFTLTVRVSDGILSDNAIITVNLTNVNEAPVAVDATVSVEENKANASVLHAATGSDLDASTVFHYTIISGNPNNAFAINTNSGVITVNNAAALDFETTPVFTLTIRVSDGSLYDDATITVNLLNVNEAPVAADASLSLEENKANGHAVHTVAGNDVDASTVLSYSITSGNANSAFNINASTGVITVNNSSALDLQTTPVFTLIIRVSDGSLSDDATIRVNLTNVNQAPVALEGSVILEENKLNGTAVHTAMASDPDAGTVLRYSIISGNNNGAFTINGTTGVITVDNAAALDFETTPVFTLTIRASDGSLSDDAITTVNLANVNEAPVALDVSVSLKENKANGASVIKVIASDPDAATVFNYSLVSGNTHDAFAIDRATGVITVNNAVILDFETTPVFTLAVQVSDGDISDHAIVTINLTNVNEAPWASDALVLLDENTIAGTPVYSVPGQDPDRGTKLDYTIVGGNNDDAFAISDAGMITVNNLNALDFELVQTFSLVVRLTDSELFDEAVMTIQLNNVNEAPMISDVSIAVEENSSNGTIVHRVAALDPDSDDELSFAFNGGNLNTAFAINANTGEISVNDEDHLRNTLDQEFRLGVLVTDRNGLTAEATITVQILPADFVTITPLRGFSPNGDGINDFWVIEGIEDFPENSVKVFNRWGNVVFETQDYDNARIAWRGENDRDTFESTYYFIITVPDLKPITGYLVVKKG